MNSFRFTTLVALFCVILIISNIASTKMTQFTGLTLDAGTILFPLSYIFGDIFAEVYGWKVSRKIILLGFACIVLNAAILYIVQVLPVAGFWENQGSYEAILGLVPRITLGSIFGYLAGSFSNAWTLLAIRKMTGERWLWMRTVGSTIVGQTFDSTVFCLIAFLGTMGNVDLVYLLLSNIVFKVAIEALFTPVTYRIVKYMKQ
jgi:queuosine precursor transporter